MHKNSSVVLWLIAVSLILILTAGIVSAATVTQSISFQGNLTNAAGTPLTGTYTVTFRLFNVETGGIALATDTHSVTAAKGSYLTTLTFPAGLYDGQGLWVGIQRSPDPEKSPRTMLYPVPYAISLRPGALINANGNSYGIRVNKSDAGGSGILANIAGPSGNGFYALMRGTGDNGFLTVNYGGGGSGATFVTHGMISPGVSSSTWGTGSDGVDVKTIADNSIGVNITTGGFGSKGIYVVTSGQQAAAIHAIAHGIQSNAVVGETSADGPAAVAGLTTGNGSYGLYAKTTGSSSPGVYASTSGQTSHGLSAVTTGKGSYAVYARTTNTSTPAVYAQSYGQNSAAIYGKTNCPGCNGVVGETTANGPAAIAGITSGTGSPGVYASTSGANSNGIHAYSARGNGIYAEAGPSGGYAALLRGNVNVLSKSSGASVLELGEGLDYSEGFDVSGKASITPGTVLIISPNDPGTLTISSTPYDRKVAGIMAGANGLGSAVKVGGDRFDANVALAGRVYCNVDATYGAVEPGDQLTTSATPGDAMVVQDYSRAQGATIGKAMERLEEGQTGQILVLVTLQ